MKKPETAIYTTRLRLWDAVIYDAIFCRWCERLLHGQRSSERLMKMYETTRLGEGRMAQTHRNCLSKIRRIAVNRRRAL